MKRYFNQARRLPVTLILMLAAIVMSVALAIDAWAGQRAAAFLAKRGMPLIAGGSGAPRLSEHATFSEMDNLNGSDGEPGLQDIGGTNGQSDYVSMKNYARAIWYVVLGTWNATDDLDECRIQQATSAAGGSVKDLTTDASGGDYDTDNPIDADGDFVIVEIRAEDMDVDNLFNHIRGYVAEGGNTGTDNVLGVLMRYGYQYPQKELQGAAVTGSKVYVDTGTGT